MARYWEEMNYPQPTEEELQENAKNTRKKAAAKGQTLHPIVIKSRQIRLPTAGGARHGVRTSNAMLISIPDCRAADAMSARAQ